MPVKPLVSLALVASQGMFFLTNARPSPIARGHSGCSRRSVLAVVTVTIVSSRYHQVNTNFFALGYLHGLAWSVLGQAGLCADFTQEVFPEANTFESNLGAIITADPQGAPVNNRCVNAIFIDLDTPTCGNTEEAVVDFPNQALCGWRTDRPAIWYGFVGTGKPMTSKYFMYDGSMKKVMS